MDCSTVGGPTARTLGVRVPPAKKTDIVPAADDAVGPMTGGMSVAPHIRFLPFYRVPARYRALVPDAHGKDRDACWRMGDGPFVAAPVAAGLTLRPDSKEHGVVEPAASMLLTEYQSLLAGTRDNWQLVDP